MTRPAGELPTLAAFGLAVVLISTNFDIGYRATADQIQSTDYAMKLSLHDLLMTDINGAIHQGRAGFLIALPLLSLGAYYGDFFLYPVLCIGIFGLIIYSTFRWIEILFGGRIALPMTAVYLALLPVGINHWLPNAYAMQFVPLALALPARNVLLARWDTTGPPLRVLLTVVVFLGALSYELFFSMLLAMLLVEVGLMVFDSEKRDCLRGQFMATQAGVLIAAASIIVGFRWTFPSKYEGNHVGGLAVLPDALETSLRHIKDSTSISIIVRPPKHPVTIADWMAAGLVGIGLGAAAFRFDAIVSRHRGLILIGIGLLIALAVTFPLGLSAKYIDLCLNSGNCRYLDNRLALLGLVIADLGLGFLLFNPRVYRTLLVLVTMAVGAATHLANAREKGGVDFGRRAEDEAKTFVCRNPDPASDVRTLAEKLASSRVFFHPQYTTEDKVAYWTNYVGHLRSSRFWFCP